MDFINTLLAKPLLALKIAGAALVGLLILVFALQLISASFSTFRAGLQPMSIASDYGEAVSYAGEYDAYAREGTAEMAQLSVRNAAGTMFPPVAPSPRGDAEAFEVTTYNATIETRDKESACGDFAELKRRNDVIFEHANTYDHGCNFTFKVERESVEVVLAWLRDLNPKELSENTYTIKRQIDDFTSEVEVLEKKRISLDETLAKALTAYDEITVLATRTQNADALAKIIDSKIGIIERLTQERILINEQLDRLARAKEDQLDRLEYTYFAVDVFENPFLDGEQLKDSWKAALRGFVSDMNTILQELSIRLILLVFVIAQWILYALIALLVAKYCWKFGKILWFK